MKSVKFLIFLILFSGCTLKTQKVQVVIKTPKIKLNEIGFLNKNKKEITIYKGVVPFKIALKRDKICFNKQCVNKKEFTNQLGYPEDFLDNILNKKPLNFLGKIVKRKDGFFQKKGKILYIITKNKILFKDKKNLILIKDLDD